MSSQASFVSFFDLRSRNRGSYDSPFSGVGVEFSPLSASVGRDQILVHEVGYLEENDWWNFPNTISPFWRLYYNFREGHRIECGSAEIPLEPGHLILIPDHLLFHSRGTVKVPHFWTAFSLGLSPRDNGPWILPAQDHEIEAIRRISDCFEAPMQARRFPVLHETSALLHRLITRPELDWNESPRSTAAAKAAAHISRNYAADLNLKEVARLAGVSSRTLTKLFLREFHMPPSRFIAKVRVGEAAKMLSEGSATLETIAEKTGFPNRFYFTRVFTRLAGISPAKYRRQQKPDAAA